MMTSTKHPTLPPTLPATGFVRLSQLLGEQGQPGPLPVSAATLWRLVRRGEFPAPIKLTSKVTVWRVEDVVEWLAEAQG